jgi:hypothetical protein
MKTGEIIELHDPYDASKPDHQGVLRYLYPEAELRSILQDSRFEVREVKQWRPGFYLLLGTRGVARPSVGSSTQ